MRWLLIGALLFSAVESRAFADPGAGERRSDSRCQVRRNRRARRGSGGGLTPSYRRMRDRWHRAASRALTKRWLEASPRPLVLRQVNSGVRFEVLPTPEGAFDAAALATAREAFRDVRRDGATGDVHPRLLELVYRAVQRFETPFVHLVSGFRTTRSTSRHNQGRAIDLVLPGVPDARLAAYLREQGFVGVGIYSTSGFVHLDVRSRSRFWRDASPPGGRQRNRPMLAAAAYRFDARARRRGEVAVEDLDDSDDE